MLCLGRCCDVEGGAKRTLSEDHRADVHGRVRTEWLLSLREILRCRAQTMINNNNNNNNNKFTLYIYIYIYIYIGLLSPRGSCH